MNVPGSPEPLSNRSAAWRAALGRWLDRLLPNACFLCHGGSGGALLCPHCSLLLPVLGVEAACPCCALPDTGGELCGRCLAHPRAFDATLAAFRYDFPIVEIIHALKYGGQLALAAELGQRMARLADQHWDAIVPVPIHAARLAERGFNQSVELARPIARRWALPLWREVVVRCRDTAPQAGLAMRHRQRNLRHAFAVRRELTGLSLLVVDDVMTTGATLHELAHTLKQAGAARVVNLVVARTPGASA